MSPGQANNYQYEGPPYATAPALGTYGVSVRGRKVGSAVWTYCDSTQTTMDFLYDAIPTLEVVYWAVLGLRGNKWNKGGAHRAHEWWLCA